MAGTRVHKIMQRTRANGPGVRFCIWTQGCTIRCSGCVNPETHDPSGGFDLAIPEIIDRIANEIPGIEGVSISGGEPMDQSEELLELVSIIRAQFDLSIILWTGYDVQELDSSPYYQKISRYVDVAIVGRYVQELHDPLGLKGSRNQKYIFFTSLYSSKDLEKVPIAEVSFDSEGVAITGIDTEFVKEWFCNELG